jgi:two-component system, chemotaxis family, protein-glutamate methylesterase/glutaminase
VVLKPKTGRKIMAPFRILVVDDSVVMRKLLCDTLSADPELEVVGWACDGKVALAKFAQLHPDLITLDLEMPVMNGLETLGEIRKVDRSIPVIIFSMLTESGASATMEAFALGASDYATKPMGGSSPADSIESIRADLVPKIKTLCARSVKKPPSRVLSVPPPPPPLVRAPALVRQRIDIVTIGTSTGGPTALVEVLSRIPQDFPVPIVLVQHMPPIFTRRLAERLDSHSKIQVQEGRAGAILRPGQAWIAPGNFHMTVKRSKTESCLELNQTPPANSCRPAVDVLFRSVAEAYTANVLAVVMTGMGADGMAGARCIRQVGGEVIIQDEASSVVWGMPGSVHAAGLADAVYPLDQLAAEITQRVFKGRALRVGAGR